MHTQVLIIGSGPAGYTAAIYTARAGLKTTLMTGQDIGGQLTRTHSVENFPGFINISGFDLMDNLKSQSLNTGATIIQDEVIKLDTSKRPFHFETHETKGTADAVILATGASPKWLQTKGEEKFKGNGISICATCDGFFYKNKSIAVIGGGNGAIYEALFLSKIASNVYLINKNNNLKGEKKLLDELLKNDKIKVLNNTKPLEFIGEKKLSTIKLKNTKSKNITLLDVEGVFEAVGTTPNTNLIIDQLKLTQKGYVKTNKRTMETSVKGVFACGDVQEDTYKQAIISAGSGAVAALSVEKYLL